MPYRACHLLTSLLAVAIASLAMATRTVRADAPATAPAADLAVAFDATGLSKLTWRGSDLLASGTVELQDLKLDGGDVLGVDFSKTAETFDPATSTLLQTYPWGTIRVTYRPDPAAGMLHATIDVANTGHKAVTRLGAYLLRWRSPSLPKSEHWDGTGLTMHNREDDFPIVTADWTTARLALCSDDLSTPVTFGVQPIEHTDATAIDAVTFRFDDGKPIAPGEMRRASLSVRLAGPERSLNGFVGDVLRAYAARYPSELDWPDHRPIGSAFLATSEKGYKTNPRGWFLDPNLDVTTADGRAALADELSKYTDAVIAHCKKLDAQGVLVWDLEGQEMPHATSYLADPRMLPQVAPEMDGLADGFFKKLADAGLRTGLTIRPTRVVKADGGRPGWMQQDVADPVAEMDDKISYAVKRWGCSIFYLDSNVSFVRDAAGKILDDPALPADDFATLARHHRSCLLIPEHKVARYWAYTAPYSEFRLGFKGTPEDVRLAYPRAFSVMQVVDGPPLGDPEPVRTLTAAINHGDVLLFRPWWDDPQTTDIEHLYAAARASPPPPGR
jgi:hypothetical protein